MTLSWQRSSFIIVKADGGKKTNKYFNSQYALGKVLHDYGLRKKRLKIFQKSSVQIVESKTITTVTIFQPY